MLSSEDENSESSKTEVPEPVKDDSEKLVLIRGATSVVWKFIANLTSIKPFPVNAAELTLQPPEAIQAICCTTFATTMSWNIEIN